MKKVKWFKAIFGGFMIGVAVKIGYSSLYIYHWPLYNLIDVSILIAMGALAIIETYSEYFRRGESRRITR